MDDGQLSLSVAAPRAVSRREWLAHCTGLVAAATLALPAPATAQWRPQATTSRRPPPEGVEEPSGGRAVPQGAAARSRDKSILVVGDSLSAEYGIRRGSGWVALLDARLSKNKLPASVINASISGDTTSGGRSRLPALLKQHRPNIVILELGGNDALRGLPLAMTRDNLDAMAREAKAAGAKVVITGMQLPPNYGRQYGDEFAGLFATVAKAAGAALVPFLLKGVADGPQPEALFQADRIHPKEAAHPVILDNVWPVLEPLLRS